MHSFGKHVSRSPKVRVKLSRYLQRSCSHAKKILKAELRRFAHDEQSIAVIEHAILFSLLGCLFSLVFTSFEQRARAAGICALNVPSQIANLDSDKDHLLLEKKWHLNDLAGHLAISVESARQLHKDEPDVIRASALRRKQGAPYRIPDSVARRVYCRNGGLVANFKEDHYTIRLVAAALGLSRETTRLLVRDEPGVLKIRIGKKKSHRLYSIPRPVLLQLRTRLLNGA